MATSDKAVQKKLLAFLKRRHPEYESSLAHWSFLEDTYHGGRGWFAANIFKYMKEGDGEFAARLARAYRFNHTREVVDLIQKYIFKGVINRSEDSPETMKTFWKSVTQSDLDITQFMSLVSMMSSIFGMIWVFTDTNKTEEVTSLADEKNAKVRAYAYIVKPQNVLDFGFDDNGELDWILIRETNRDDKDPIESTGEVSERFRLWTRYDWTLYEIINVRGAERVIVVDAGVHDLKRVPCFPVAHVIGEHRYTAPGLINDIAYLDRAIANYLSNLDAIIQDQTFSQLAIPAQSYSGEVEQLVEMGVKRIFTYDSEGGVPPQFISPDIKQAQIIIQVVNKIIGEIYHTIGMAGERTKQDNAVGIDNSSGVAKAYDFDRVNSLLVSKAGSLENAENKLVSLISAWHGEKTPVDELVSYPDNFDVRSLFDEFTVAEKLTLIDAPEDVRREQMKQIIAKLFPSLKEKLLDAMLANLKEWPVVIEPDPTGAPTKFGGSAKSPTKSRQGSVTKDTPK